MARLKPVSRASVENAIVHWMYDRKYGPGGDVQPTVTGAPGDWEAVWAAAPDVLEHVIRGFAYWRSHARKLDGVLRELSLARTGWLVESKFVYSQHCKVLRAYGGTEQQVRDIGAWEISRAYNDVERLVLAFTDRLCLHGGDVPDALFAALQAQLCDEAIVELGYICAMYASLGPLTRALKLEYDEREEGVSEVPAPATFRADAARQPMPLPPRQ